MQSRVRHQPARDLSDTCLFVRLYLKKRSIKDIYLMGLALDYCVK
jgi:hypothetical protein